jgi:hypothetical protein
VSAGEIGSQSDGSAIADASVGEPARRAQGVTEIGMAFSEIGDVGEGPADQLDRPIGIAPVQGDQPEKVEGIWIGRQPLEKLTIKRLGEIHLSCPVVLKGDGQAGGRRDYRCPPYLSIPQPLLTRTVPEETPRTDFSFLGES